MGDAAAPPDRLPAGAELPDGRVLAYPAHRRCPCADCAAAFEAWEEGELILPDDDEGDDLPW